MPTRDLRHAAVLAAGALLLAGCEGAQSTLAPAGRGAERIAVLFWWMAGAAVVIWLAVMGLALYSMFTRVEPSNNARAKFLIIGGGAVVPTVVLGVLIIFGMPLLPDLVASAPEGSLKVEVRGAQWWWRVRYLGPEGDAVELANEIRLPVSEPVQFELESEDVIHSFWIPSLGGKVDMIPGRRTHLALEPTRTGIYRGVCAEYCGTSHALMGFDVVVVEKEEFDRWLRHQRQPARPPSEPVAERGQQVFLANGCGACHTIRGTEANGVIAPDLTHVGSRLSIGAGTLPNEPDDFHQWIAGPKRVKPGVLMPAFGMLPQEDLRSLAIYLESLE